MVPHRSTDEACSGLTAQFGRDTVCYTEYGRRHYPSEFVGFIFRQAIEAAGLEIHLRTDGYVYVSFLGTTSELVLATTYYSRGIIQYYQYVLRCTAN